MRVEDFKKLFTKIIRNLKLDILKLFPYIQGITYYQGGPKAISLLLQQLDLG